MAVAERGFTLIELLLVLVIGAAMYALVPPMFSAGMAGAELKGATREVAAGLRQARGQAIRMRQEAVLSLDLENKTFTVAGDARRHVLPKRVELKLFTAQSEVDARVGRIRFFPDGGSTGGRVTLGVGDKKFLVDVDWLTGRVTIAEPS